MDLSPKIFTTLRIAFLFLIIVTTLPFRLASQPVIQMQKSLSLSETEKIIKVDSSKQIYSLADSFLVHNSEIIWADSVVLKKEKDYSLDYING